MTSYELGCLPNGYNIFVSILARQLRVSERVALEHVCQTNGLFRSFIENYLTRRTEYAESIIGPRWTEDLVSLSGEIHFGGSFVFNDKKNDCVIYSSKRAWSSFTKEASTLLPSWLGTYPFVRLDIENTEQYFSRPYINSNAISDEIEASAYSGSCLAFAWFISLTDMHESNVLFHNNRPVLIDDECALQPLRQSQVAALNPGRERYHESPFRTILVQESHMGDRKASAGFKHLFSAKYDRRIFIDTFKNCSERLQNEISCAIDIVSECAARGQTVRYILRSTEFYDLCIYKVAEMHFLKYSQSKMEKELRSLFDRELALFPETDAFVSSEISSLLTGEVPYWLLKIDTGDIVDGAGNIFLRITSPKKWLIAQHKYIENYPISKAAQELQENIPSF